MLLYWNTGGPSSLCEELFFFNLFVNAQLVKRDIATTVIYHYTMTKFH